MCRCPRARSECCPLGNEGCGASICEGLRERGCHEYDGAGCAWSAAASVEAAKARADAAALGGVSDAPTRPAPHAELSEIDAAVAAHAAARARDAAARDAQHGRARKMFEQLDANADGAVSGSEFVAAMRRRAANAEASVREVMRAFGAMDADGDRKLVWQEFVAFKEGKKGGGGGGSRGHDEL